MYTGDDFLARTIGNKLETKCNFFIIIDIIKLREKGLELQSLVIMLLGRQNGFGCKLPLPTSPQTWNAKAHNFCTFLFRRWVHNSHVNLH